MAVVLPGYLADVFPAEPPRNLVSAYAIWGGMPRYWELAEPYGGDFDAAVDALILDPAGPLHDEPDRLLRSEMPPATALRPLLDVIGGGAHRLSEIADRLGKPASSLSRPLAALMEMNFVRRETPFGSSPASGKRSLYGIDDPFLRLWFAVAAPHRAALAEAPPDTRRRYWERRRTAARRGRATGSGQHGGGQRVVRPRGGGQDRCRDRRPLGGRRRRDGRSEVAAAGR